jgi:phosphatidylglycerophosphate synthase
MRKLNIADWLSIYRIVSAPALLIFMLLEQRYIFATLLLISLFTDMLDGFLARRLKISSIRGAQLDSIGDRITFIIGVSGLLVFEKDFLSENYRLIAFALIPYFFSLVFSFVRYGRPSSFHTYSAKLGALLQGLFLLSLYFFGSYFEFFIFTLVVSMLAAIEENILIALLPVWRTDVKGLYWLLIKRKNILNKL